MFWVSGQIWYGSGGRYVRGLGADMLGVWGQICYGSGGRYVRGLGADM